MSDYELKVGVLGATGMVGQRFITLLKEHPWFNVVALAASPRSAGKTYKEAVGDRWTMDEPIPKVIGSLTVMAAEGDMAQIAKMVDLVFCAVDMSKDETKKLEEDYAAAGVAVVSNNSAHRWTDDVPILMPEINPDHIKLIDAQRQNRGWKSGLIAVKPNCSIQSYVSILTALAQYGPEEAEVVSLQAISGAGKTFASWPEMVDNVIPLIPKEEDKSENEPTKIWGKLTDGQIELAALPRISATCIRVPVTDGHLASVKVKFKKPPTKQEIIDGVANYNNPIAALKLPSAPKQLIHYFEADDRPQTALDRNLENGMAISMGRLRQDKDGSWRFIALSHNTIRGAAGGAVLMAELLVKKGYIKSS